MSVATHYKRVVGASPSWVQFSVTAPGYNGGKGPTSIRIYTITYTVSIGAGATYANTSQMFIRLNGTNPASGFLDAQIFEAGKIGAYPTATKATYDTFHLEFPGGMLIPGAVDDLGGGGDPILTGGLIEFNGQFNVEEGASNATASEMTITYSFE